MQEPTTPLNETQRLRSLLALRILDTPAEERFDRITRLAKRMFGVETCLVSLVDSGRQWFKSKQGLDACETARSISFCGHSILSNEILVVDDASSDERFADNPLVTDAPNIRFYAGCPIHGPYGYRVGTLCIIDSAPRQLSAEDREALRDCAAMVEYELKVTAQATIDELTKIANRRGFINVADHMLALCRRTDTPAELMFFDLDGFKKINDVHGHEAGDELLSYFAELLTRCFREADVIARWGGDEFVVLMTGSRNNSELAIRRLRKMAAESQCWIQRELAWSTGCIDFDPQRHDSTASLLVDADKGMYVEKLSRRA